MPNTKSAEKALRQGKKRAAQNQIVKDAYKQAIRVVFKAIEAGKDVQEVVRLAQKKLDKAAKYGIIKSNTAARKLSRLMKKANAAVAE